MPVGLNPKYEKSSIRQKLVHGQAVFNNSGKIILQSNNLGNLFKNFKRKDTTRIKQLLNKINSQYIKNVKNMIVKVKNAREYGLSNGNNKHRYMYEYWKWLSEIIPFRTPLKVIQRPKNYGNAWSWRNREPKRENYGNAWRWKKNIRGPNTPPKRENYGNAWSWKKVSQPYSR